MDSSSHELHHLLMDLVRTAGIVMIDQAVPGKPVSLSQLFALHELDHESGLSQRELAARLGLEKSSVSRLVADLEADGLVTRERDPANRRLYRLEITAAGSRLHREIGGSLHERYLAWADHMSPDERDGLAKGLPALMRAIHAERSTGD